MGGGKVGRNKKYNNDNNKINQTCVCVRVFGLPVYDWLSSADCLCLQRSSWRLYRLYFFNSPKKKEKSQTMRERGGIQACERSLILKHPHTEQAG